MLPAGAGRSAVKQTERKKHGNLGFPSTDAPRHRRGRPNKDGSLKANILDLVSEDNGVLDDTTFMRADDGDKLSTDFRNLNPHGTWVALNEGVPASKTGFSTAWDTCGRIKARIEIPMDT